MRLLILLTILILNTSASARTISLLGETAAYAAIDVIEEHDLQAARGEPVDEKRAFADLYNGAYIVDGAAWVAGERLTKHGLKAAGVVLGPFVGSLVANLGAELLSNGLTTVYKGNSIDWADLATRSVISAAGGAIGQALCPVPVVGWAIGTIAADLLYENMLRQAKDQVTTSKPAEWYRDEAPPLGPYRAPAM